MSLLISESSTEPVTLAQAKAWGRIENSSEDDLITSLLTSCRREVESYTKNSLITQTWQTTHNGSDGKYMFYSPRMTVSSVVVTVDGESYTDYVLNPTTGRLRLNDQYYGDEEIVITWSIVTTLSNQASLIQALKDLITYRFYNRSQYDLPANVMGVLNQYRIFNV